MKRRSLNGKAFTYHNKIEQEMFDHYQKLFLDGYRACIECMVDEYFGIKKGNSVYKEHEYLTKKVRQTLYSWFEYTPVNHISGFESEPEGKHFHLLAGIRCKDHPMKHVYSVIKNKGEACIVQIRAVNDIMARVNKCNQRTEEMKQDYKLPTKKERFELESPESKGEINGN
jgi:hypothetical protein